MFKFFNKKDAEQKENDSAAQNKNQSRFSDHKRKEEAIDFGFGTPTASTDTLLEADLASLTLEPEKAPTPEPTPAPLTETPSLEDVSTGFDSEDSFDNGFDSNGFDDHNGFSETTPTASSPEAEASISEPAIEPLSDMSINLDALDLMGDDAMSAPETAPIQTPTEAPMETSMDAPTNESATFELNAVDDLSGTMDLLSEPVTDNDSFGSDLSATGTDNAFDLTDNFAITDDNNTATIETPTRDDSFGIDLSATGTDNAFDLTDNFAMADDNNTATIETPTRDDSFGIDLSATDTDNAFDLTDNFAMTDDNNTATIETPARDDSFGIDLSATGTDNAFDLADNSTITDDNNNTAITNIDLTIDGSDNEQIDMDAVINPPESVAEKAPEAPELSFDLNETIVIQVPQLAGDSSVTEPEPTELTSGPDNLLILETPEIEPEIDEAFNRQFSELSERDAALNLSASAQSTITDPINTGNETVETLDRSISELKGSIDHLNARTEQSPSLDDLANAKAEAMAEFDNTPVLELVPDNVMSKIENEATMTLNQISKESPQPDLILDTSSSDPAAIVDDFGIELIDNISKPQFEPATNPSIDEFSHSLSSLEQRNTDFNDGLHPATADPSLSPEFTIESPAVNALDQSIQDAQDNLQGFRLDGKVDTYDLTAQAENLNIATDIERQAGEQITMAELDGMGITGNDTNQVVLLDPEASTDMLINNHNLMDGSDAFSANPIQNLLGDTETPLDITPAAEPSSSSDDFHIHMAPSFNDDFTVAQQPDPMDTFTAPEHVPSTPAITEDEPTNDLEVLESWQLSPHTCLRLIEVDSQFALMSTSGESSAMQVEVVKIFDNNPLSNVLIAGDGFSAQKEGQALGQDLYQVQIGDWRAVISEDNESHVVSLHTEL